MAQKGVYPYDYMDSFDKFNKKLPSKEEFYSILNNEHTAQGSKLRPIRSHLRLNFTYLRLDKRRVVANLRLGSARFQRKNNVHHCLWMKDTIYSNRYKKTNSRIFDRQLDCHV